MTFNLVVYILFVQKKICSFIIILRSNSKRISSYRLRWFKSHKFEFIESRVKVALETHSIINVF